MPDAYVLFGFPVHHSWSPFIHGMFARQAGQEMSYRLFETPPERFRNDALAFFSGGGAGANVTLPHKRAAADLVNELTRRAQLADAVNTIVRRDERLVGDNTDGAGLLADLTQNLELRWSSPRILLLGAGGAARGVMEPLLSLQPELLVIANRTADRAVALAREFAELGPVVGCEFSKLEHRRFDLIVNATSASLHGDVPLVADRRRGLDDDLLRHGLRHGRYRVRRAGRSGWVPRAREQGWGMLVEQAAEAFQLWRGVRPDTGPVLEVLRQRAAMAARSPS